MSPRLCSALIFRASLLLCDMEKIKQGALKVSKCFCPHSCFNDVEKESHRRCNGRKEPGVLAGSFSPPGVEGDDARRPKVTTHPLRTLWKRCRWLVACRQMRVFPEDFSSLCMRSGIKATRRCLLRPGLPEPFRLPLFPAQVYVSLARGPGAAAWDCSPSLPPPSHSPPPHLALELISDDSKEKQSKCQ